MSKKIDFREKNNISKINKLLIEILLMVKENLNEENKLSLKNDEYINYQKKINAFLSIYQFESNIKEVLEDSKNCLSNKLDLDLLTKMVLDDNKEIDTEKKYLKIFNKKLKDYLYSEEMYDFEFIAPINVEFKNDVTDSKLLDIFGFNEISIDKIKEKNKYKKGRYEKEFYELLNEYDYILYAKYKARNDEFAFDKVSYQLKSLLGVFSFSKDFLRYHFSFNSYPTYQDHSLIKLNAPILLNLSLNIDSLHAILCEMKYFNKEALDKLNRGRLIILSNILDNMPEWLRNSLKKAFYHYYHASTNKDLDYSFFHFWLVIEETIKNAKAKRDDEIIKIIKSILKNESDRNMVDHIQKTRNKFTHKGENVTKVDRNAVKITADWILNELLLNMSEIENKKQYHIYLSNVGKKRKIRNENLNDFCKVLNLISKNESLRSLYQILYLGNKNNHEIYNELKKLKKDKDIFNSLPQNIQDSINKISSMNNNNLNEMIFKLKKEYEKTDNY